MTGKAEHKGNRNYLGQQRIEQAKSHIIHHELTNIANVRKNSVALQRGLQINLDFKGNLASFYRVYQHKADNQTALVLLNKGDTDAEFNIKKMLSNGLWTDAMTGQNTLLITLTQPSNHHGKAQWCDRVVTQQHEQSP